MTESDTSMNYSLAAGTGDQNDNDIINEAIEAEKSDIDIKDHPGEDEDSLKHVVDYDSETTKREVMEQSVGTKIKDDTGEVNTEATITADDVMRAGGFGARDDISSILPVAIDSTDFEALLRDARDFEEPQGEILRPGLGWTESMDEK